MVISSRSHISAFSPGPSLDDESAALLAQALAHLVRATPSGSAVGYCVDRERLGSFVGWTSSLGSQGTTVSGAPVR